MGGKQYSDGQKIQVSALSKTTAKPNTHVTQSMSSPEYGYTF